MKKFSLFAFAAAGLLLGACSDKDVAEVNPVNPSEFEDGAFIGITLTLPSADNATRANDELSNGIEAEFAVKNATLYIFKGADEASATFVDYVALGVKYDQDDQPGIDPDVWGVQDPEIETKITSTSLNEATKIDNELAKAIKADNTNNYYAYVIINHNGQVPAPTKDETTFEDFSKAQFTEIGADIAAEQNIYESGMLMTSAPICDNPGGSAAPVSAKYSTLVPFDKSKIFGSAAQAKQEPAACIYVERAAAKITVAEGDNLGNPEIDDYTVSIIGWQVINNEKTYYNTRQINYKATGEEPADWQTDDWGPYANGDVATTTNKYRFVSLYKFDPTLPSGLKDGYTHTTGYRTYFASDPHYNVDATAAAVTDDGVIASTLDNTVASDDRPWIAVGAQKHAYTTENTFDVGRQTWRNTTMVTLKAQIGDGTTGFYTVGKGSQTILPTADDAKAAIVNFIKGDNDVAAALTALRTIISKNNTNQEVTSGLKVEFTAPTEGTTDVPFTVDAAFKLENQDYTNFNNTVQDANGKTEKDYYDELIAAVNAVIKTTTGTGSAAVTTTAENVLLSYYAGGVSYYNVRIQHFGEPETPWSAGGDYITGGGKDVKEIYGYDTTKGATDGDNVLASQRFLGRYGVVRDNWYKLSIDKIGKIGTAEPVDPSTTTPDTPDDEIENYISVHVHIVPWVLRSQSVIL